MLKTIVAKSNFDQHKLDVIKVYRETYSGDPYFTSEEDLDKFENDDWPERIKEKDFTLIVVKDDDEPVGMAYGWTSVAGAFWTNKLEKELGSDFAEWTRDNFEFVDLAVRPKFQGKGAGKLLYSEVFANISNKTAILYTLQSDTVAYKMYLKLGWQVLRDNLVFKSGKPFVLMGKKL